MSWWKELLKQIATNFGLAVAAAGTETVTDKIGPTSGTGKSARTPK